MIAIIPAASGYPADSARSFATTMRRHGARAQDIVVIHLAVVDDPTTPDIDESRWAANSGNTAEIAKLERAGAIWFTGGDQLRTTRLLAPDGKDSPMLAAIRQRLAAGAIIGGSSAGAAVMSRTMITNGESIVALTQPVLRQTDPDNRDAIGTLVLGDGLGFLPHGIVDQHFDARARLGRLARALFELPPDHRFGFGIDEDTALLVRLGAGTADVLGSGQITVLDARAASASTAPALSASGLRLSLLSAGDTLLLPSLAASPAPGRRAIARASDAAAATDAGGFALPPERTAGLLIDGLMRGTPDAMLTRTSFRQDVAVRYRFFQTPESAAAEGGSAGSRAGVTITDVMLEIQPAVLPMSAPAR